MRKKQQVASLSLAMKIFVQLTLGMVFTCSLYATPSSAQEILDRSVSVSASNIEITKVIAKVQKQSGVKFVFSPNSIEAERKISCNIKDKPLSEFLNQVLNPLGIGYNIVEEQVVLYALKTTSAQLGHNKDVYAKTITGIITNQAGEPLVGASINVKNTNRYTTSNAKGEFTIEVEDNNAILVISYTGYAAKEITVGNANSINVVLAAVNNTMDEVVVVGYGTQSRRNVTTAISSIDNKTLNELAVPNLAQALQGRMAGVSVVNNGTPGSQPIVRIRGISSITSSADPLYVVDGIPTGDISSFDMRDVESVDVLKDASAAAIYGSRATNGVIIITTKKGKRDSKLHVGLNSYYGVQRVTKRLDLLNPVQFDSYAKAYRGSLVPRRDPNYESSPGVKPNYPAQPIFPGASTTYGNNVTDWQDEYFRDGSITETNIDLNGGNQVSRFGASAGYTNQKGTAPNVAFKRYNLRLSSEHNISKVFTFGQTLIVSNSIQRGDANTGGTRGNLINVIRMMPYMPVYDPTSKGGYRGVSSPLDGGDPTNPIEDAELKNPQTNSNVKLLGNAFLEINILKSLKFKSSFGIDYANGRFFRFQPIFDDNGTVAGSNSTTATVTENRNTSTVLLYTEQLTYDKRFDQHHLNATAVFESQHQKTRSLNGSGQQPSNDLRVLQNATNPTVSSGFGENFLISVVGRVNYDFAGKYMLSASMRRDGLSVWAPGHKWGNFPAASVGWKIDEESFMENLKLISELKLRGGYGITGINGTSLGNTPWLVNVSGNSSSYPFNNAVPPNGLGSSINSLGNRDLEWETTKQTNIGVDLGVLNNKFTLTADYFYRKTDNLILNVQTPPSFGYPNRGVRQNVGSMENKGIELLLGYHDRSGDFKWNASANASFIRNKVLELAPGLTNLEAGAEGTDYSSYAVTNTEPGRSIQYFYGFIVDGIFQSKTEVDASAVQVNPKAGEVYDPKKHTSPGDIKFRDLNKDGVIDVKDRTYLGSYLPKIAYGLNLSADYKNFDFTVFLQGVQGNKIYNNVRFITEGMLRFFNAGTQVLNAWTPTNTNTTIPRAVASDPNGNSRVSTRFLEDGSYLRLKNITLGYRFPAARLSSLTKGTVSGFRFYVSGQNLLTFTDYSGFDPEVGTRTGGNQTNGIDFAVYPQPKTVQVGIQVNFQ
jgi:TonB-dependent starch-binding outer membrane protein SusC